MFTKECVRRILIYMLQDAGFDLTYRLFKNNHTVDEDSDLADFTESDFTGYAALSGVAEPAVTVNVDDEANSLGNTLTWTASADLTPPQQAFGMYVTFEDHVGDTRLFFAWNFSSPTTLAFNGDKVEKKVDWYCRDYPP